MKDMPRLVDKDAKKVWFQLIFGPFSTALRPFFGLNLDYFTQNAEREERAAEKVEAEAEVAFFMLFLCCFYAVFMLFCGVLMLFECCFCTKADEFGTDSVGEARGRGGGPGEGQPGQSYWFCI